MNTNGVFSHNTDLWATPQWLFDELDAKYHFTVDVCATPDNAKCAKYYTETQDGLVQEWTGNVWCNPPYGRQIAKWVKKASECAADVVVMLLPARTDTAWFHDYCLRGGQITFLRGRLKFGNATSGAPFPSMIVVFDKNKVGGSNQDPPMERSNTWTLIPHLHTMRPKKIRQQGTSKSGPVPASLPN